MGCLAIGRKAGQGGDQGHSLAPHRLEGSVVRESGVDDDVGPGVHRDTDARRPDRMGGDLPIGGVSLLDRGAELVGGQLHIVRMLEPVLGPCRDADLDQIRPVLDILADPGPEGVGSPNADPEITGAPGDAEPGAGGDDSRAFHRAFRDRVTQDEVGVADRAEILHCREAGHQGGPGVRLRLAAQRQVDVSVDQSREDRCVAQGDQLGRLRRCAPRGRAYRRDPIPVNLDHHIVDSDAFFHVDQATGMDPGCLVLSLCGR